MQMDTKEEMLTDAMGNVSSNYIEEALETRMIKRSAVRMRKLSAACIALAVVALCTVTVLAIKYWTPSWRDTGCRSLLLALGAIVERSVRHQADSYRR